MAPYIVLKKGIFFNKSLITCKIFFPINESEINPIKEIKIIDSAISKPGIENGKYYLD